MRILLVPVAIRQIHSMQSLQIHAPEMKAIQQRYKADRQKQSEELMKFYKENKINPYASCLPIVFQIPIFISLFFVLRDFEKEIFPQFPASSLEWLGLVDITEPTKDGWGPVLIAVYVASQLTSTYLMSTSMQSKAQRYMIMVLPIVFLPFILGFPSGLMIYWLTTNLWTTGQGLVTRRLMPRPVASAEALEPDSAEGGRGVGERRELELTARPRPAAAVERAPRGASSESAEAGPADERVERHHRRGDGRDRRRGEVGRAARARVARSGPRPRAGAVPGRLGGRARASRRRIHAGPCDRERRAGRRRRSRPAEATRRPTARARSSSGSPPGSAPTSRSPLASATASSR